MLSELMPVMEVLLLLNQDMKLLRLRVSNRFGKEVEVSFARGYSAYTPMIDGRIASPAYDNIQLAVEAVKLARESDLVIFVGGLNHNWRQDSEGYDRESYNLPYGQPELIRRILEVNSNVVLVLVSGNAVDLRFAEDVPSIVQAWYCGSVRQTTYLISCNP